jgi:hypothetical protein
MGVIIATGVHRIGHKAKFKEYLVLGSKKCEMICECGWTTEITSFGNPWCTIETQVRYNDHLINYGLQPLTKRHSHTTDEELDAI